jgi:hypothetical protein
MRHDRLKPMNAGATPLAPLGTAPRAMTLIYLSVALVAGALIALQICIMRIFAVGSWAHFGSFVVSLAMLGFGLTSVVMCLCKDLFERHAQGLIAASLLAFGPLAVASNLLAQQIPFNAVFLVSDPSQKWRLAANFLLYLLPYLAGATFLGTVFLKGRDIFGRIYFADLAGSGLCGLLLLVAMYFFAPEDLIIVPLSLWIVGSALWFWASATPWLAGSLALLAAASVAAHAQLPGLLGIPKMAQSDYKGVAYVRKFPDSRQVYARSSPFGYLEIYSSSYLHFAPGLSDNASLSLKEMPSNAYLGLYVDGEGPQGVIRSLPPSQTDYFRFLPMFYPYLIKPEPNTFVIQFGGGLSTTVALRSGARSVTVAEANPEILRAFYDDETLRGFTGDILRHPKLKVVDYEGRLYLERTTNRYDVIDLSLADSAGLSNPGGFSIVEKFPYTREAMVHYMNALNSSGILSVTIWNKEEPPKSVLKLYATMAAAALDVDHLGIDRKFFVVSSYLSTATVLYKRDGFTAAEISMLRDHTRALSFDEIYYPGIEPDATRTEAILEEYRGQIFSREPELLGRDSEVEPPTNPELSAPQSGDPLPAVSVGQAAWFHLLHGGWSEFANRYVFDVRALTNNRPYFAAYVKPADLPRTLDRLELLQDEWGYLLLWATFAVASAAGLSLILLPLAFGRSARRRYSGKLGTIVYFACLGAGYIMVEVGLIAHFNLALSNPTVSAAILISGLLTFSGLGSLFSSHYVERPGDAMPKVFLAIAVMLMGFGLLLDRPLAWIGGLSNGWRILFCLILVFPPAFLMGIPMPIGMNSLARLGKNEMFLWAWGINGCFSVIGAAVVPIIAASFGIGTVLLASAGLYLLAIPALIALLRSPVGPAQSANARVVGSG